MVDINEKLTVLSSSKGKRKYSAETESKHGKSAKLRDNENCNIKTTFNKSKKRKFKNNKFQKGKCANDAMNKAETKNAARLPQSATDWSSNWKKLLQQMEEEKKTSGGAGTRRKATGAQKQNKPSETLEINKSKPNITIKKESEIWFDNVDECLIERNENESSSDKSKTTNNEKLNISGKEDPLVKEKSFKGLTKAISMDCEMVGVGYKGSDSVLARVSIVNHFGHCVYDKYVKPREKVTDYRTAVSGIRPSDLENAYEFKEVQKEVSDILTSRVLVGHAIRHDLKVLFLDHPKRMIRDTSTYKPFKTLFGGRTPSLKNLSARMLGVSVQQGEHSSVQDAQAAMRLYTMFRKDWEKDSSKRISKANIKNKNGLSSDKSQHHMRPVNENKDPKESSSSISIGIKRNNQLTYEDSD